MPREGEFTAEGHWADSRMLDVIFTGEPPSDGGHEEVMRALLANDDVVGADADVWEVEYRPMSLMYNQDAPAEFDVSPHRIVLSVTDGRARYDPPLWYEWTVHEIGHAVCNAAQGDPGEPCAEAEQQRRGVPNWW